MAPEQQRTAREEHESQEDESAMLRTIHDASRNDESRVAMSMLLAGACGQCFRNSELAPAVYCIAARYAEVACLALE